MWATCGRPPRARRGLIHKYLKHKVMIQVSIAARLAPLAQNSPSDAAIAMSPKAKEEAQGTGRARRDEDAAEHAPRPDDSAKRATQRDVELGRRGGPPLRRTPRPGARDCRGTRARQTSGADSGAMEGDERPPKRASREAAPSRTADVQREASSGDGRRVSARVALTAPWADARLPLRFAELQCSPSVQRTHGRSCHVLRSC